MSDELGTPVYDRDDLAKAIYRMESSLLSIDDSAGAARGTLDALLDATETMKELALDVRGHYVNAQVSPRTELVRHLRHIKLLLIVIAVVAVIKLFA